VILISLAGMGKGDSEVLVDAGMTDEITPKPEKLISGLVLRALSQTGTLRSQFAPPAVLQNGLSH